MPEEVFEIAHELVGGIGEAEMTEVVIPAGLIEFENDGDFIGIVVDDVDEEFGEIFGCAGVSSDAEVGKREE